MRLQNTILSVLVFSLILSCASAQKNEGTDPVDCFLKTQDLEKNKKYILQRDKVKYTEALRLFSGGEGPEHIPDKTGGSGKEQELFEERYWRQLYADYASDTIKKYWRKENFPAYNFVLEDKKGLMRSDFMRRYFGSGIDRVIALSDPMYYKDNAYAMFYYNTYVFSGSSQPCLVIMRREKENWILEKIIGDYIFY